MDAWDIFCLTGHIDDYLHYRQTQGLAQGQTPADKEKKQVNGNIPRADSGTAFSRGQGEVH